MLVYREIKAIVERAHKNSKKVVFTHGVFDLLHVGHIKTLKESKALGDVLIVGVDSNRLVKNLKGECRPIINCEQRKEMLNELKLVDYVFEVSPTLIEMSDLKDYFTRMYSYLNIDIVTSGEPSEYKVDQRRICESLEIEYRLAGENVIETTSSIIKRIRDN